ncbi:DNA double-strand break repair Rad50 [Brachionus plicatilis]|uniref:DNA double-strand break repair Rad50 n=1 Tax=Brachionus plicatilis TaxID=10195 RepID=A0A3M7T0J8_BRAPC|nr:DNA double-strand break repair Rad50 [Brachionus plicatilis]
MLGRGSTKPKEDVAVLLKRVDEQNEQIGRLQAKFRDVTQAYKNLLNEKKALEIIVKSVDTKTALTASSRSVSNSDVSEADFHPAESGPSDEDKVHSLTANIQVLLDNKAKMEEVYKAERKKLLGDYEEMRLRCEKYRLECDKKLEVAKSQAQVQEESQNVILLRNENVDLKKKIKNLSKQFENKCEELIQANGELKQLKMAHNEQMCGDETKLADMRKLLKEANESNERRVCELETRIADLCATIAAHESPSLHANQPSESNTHSRLSENVDFDSAVEQIVYLKKFIETTAKESSINFDFNEDFHLKIDLNFSLFFCKLNYRIPLLRDACTKNQNSCFNPSITLHLAHILDFTIDLSKFLILSKFSLLYPLSISFNLSSKLQLLTFFDATRPLT